MSDEAMGAIEAAALLDVTPDMIRKRLTSGQMAGRKVGGKFWLIEAAEVRRWQAMGKPKAGRPTKEGGEVA